MYNIIEYYKEQVAAKKIRSNVCQLKKKEDAFNALLLNLLLRLLFSMTPALIAGLNYLLCNKVN